MCAFVKRMTWAGVALCALGLAHPGAAHAAAIAPDTTTTDSIPPPDIRPQCIHRQTDERPSTRSDDKLLTLWLSVPQSTLVDFAGWGTATGNRWGALSITLLLDGVAVGQSSSNETSAGNRIVKARANTLIKLEPGRQHKLTARPEAPGKTLLGFEMHVSLNRGCA